MRERSLFRGHADYLNRMSVSPDGRLLLTGGGNVDSALQLWDLETGKHGQIGKTVHAAHDEGHASQNLDAIHVANQDGILSGGPSIRHAQNMPMRG
jgi:WD40 repeat protein